MQKIYTVIRKEWAEVFKNKLVLSTVIFLPLLFTAIPLIMLYATAEGGGEELTSDMPAQFAQFCAEGLSDGECFQVFMVNQFMLLFL